MENSGRYNVLYISAAGNQSKPCVFKIITGHEPLERLFRRIRYFPLLLANQPLSLHCARAIVASESTPAHTASGYYNRTSARFPLKLLRLREADGRLPFLTGGRPPAPLIYVFLKAVFGT
jgi:hypothetical protein